MKLEDIINEYIVGKEKIARNDKFRVSDAGRCHLMRYWKRQGKEPTNLPDERVLRVFEVGHVFHVWLQDVLRKKGRLIFCEHEVEDYHRRGHIDAVVRMEDELVLYDFKTVHSRKFHNMRREEKIDLHYAMQAYTYAQMLPASIASEITDIRITYISKDDLHIEEYSVLKEFKNIYEVVEQDWTELIDAWTANREPKPNPISWECKYCIYRNECVRRGYVGEINQQRKSLEIRALQ